MGGSPRRLRGVDGCGESRSDSQLACRGPPIGLDHGCAAETWATAPPLKAMVLIGSMVSGAMKIRSPAPRNGRMDHKAVFVDQAGLDQRSGETRPVSKQVSVWTLLLESRDGCGQVSGGDRRLAAIM
jgi:hypothetical protein